MDPNNLPVVLDGDNLPAMMRAIGIPEGVLTSGMTLKLSRDEVLIAEVRIVVTESGARQLGELLAKSGEREGPNEQKDD